MTASPRRRISTLNRPAAHESVSKTVPTPRAPKRGPAVEAKTRAAWAAVTGPNAWRHSRASLCAEFGLTDSTVGRMRAAASYLTSIRRNPAEASWDEARKAYEARNDHVAEPAYIARGREIERLAREAEAREKSFECNNDYASAINPLGPTLRPRPVPQTPAPLPAVLAAKGCAAPTMSSREIAELTGKRHGDVIRDVRVMLEALGDVADLRHVREEKDERGYTACFNLPKDLTITLVSGYNVTMRHRIVTRWMELEEQAKPAPSQAPVVLSSDPLDLLLAQAQMFPKLITELQEQKRAQAAQAQAIEAQAEKLQELKVEVAELLDYVSVYDFAKTYKLKLTTGQKVTLGKAASAECRKNGWNIKTKSLGLSEQATYPTRAIKAAAEGFLGLQLRG